MIDLGIHTYEWDLSPDGSLEAFFIPCVDLYGHNLTYHPNNKSPAFT